MSKRFGNRGNFNKKNIENAPDDKPVIYKLQNDRGKNIYTGIAKRGRVDDRLKEHLAGSKDAITGAKKFSIKQKLNIDAAKREEKKIIKKENPKYNEQ